MNNNVDSKYEWKINPKTKEEYLHEEGLLLINRPSLAEGWVDILVAPYEIYWQVVPCENYKTIQRANEYNSICEDEGIDKRAIVPEPIYPNGLRIFKREEAISLLTSETKFEFDENNLKWNIISPSDICMKPRGVGGDNEIKNIFYNHQKNGRQLRFRIGMRYLNVNLIFPEYKISKDLAEWMENMESFYRNRCKEADVQVEKDNKDRVLKEKIKRLKSLAKGLKIIKKENHE